VVADVIRVTNMANPPVQVPREERPQRRLALVMRSGTSCPLCAAVYRMASRPATHATVSSRDVAQRPTPNTGRVQVDGAFLQAMHAGSSADHPLVAPEFDATLLRSFTARSAGRSRILIRTNWTGRSRRARPLSLILEE